MTVSQIGINLLHLHPKLAGVRVFAAHLTRALSDARPDVVLHVFVGDGGQAAIESIYPDIVDHPNLTFHMIKFNPARKTALFWAENRHLPKLARALNVSFLASLDYHCPLFFHPSAFVVHDLNYLDVPEGLSRSYRLIRSFLIPLCARRANQIWTISPFTQSQFAHHYPQWAHKAHMIGSGVPQAAPPQTTLAGFDRHSPYVLSVGTFNKNKNYTGLIEAFEQLDWDGRLVIVGKKGPASDDPRIMSAKQRLGSRLVILDSGITDPELARLYAGASCYVTASLYEGYGLTLLEAMRMNVPAASSNRGSLPYVGGDAVLYFDPERQDEIVEALSRILCDDALRRDLVKKGHDVLSQQTWQAVSQKVLKHIETHDQI